MRVLVACEYSGRVRQAFRRFGHSAWSCDLLPAEDGSEFHFQADALKVIGDGWDLMVAHPPCTYLSVSGMHWTTRGLRDRKLTDEAAAFFMALAGAPVSRIAIENPVCIMSTLWREPDQVIQPHEFGHDASKATCLWLKGLPKLTPTLTVEPSYCCPCGHRFPMTLGKYGCPNCAGDSVARLAYANQTASGQNKLTPSPDRWKERSRTFEGIASAMAQQWGNYTDLVTAMETA